MSGAWDSPTKFWAPESLGISTSLALSSTTHTDCLLGSDWFWHLQTVEAFCLPGLYFRKSLPWALFSGSDLSHGAQHLSMTPLIFIFPVHLRLNCLHWPLVVWYQASGSLHDPFKPCSSQAAKTTTNQMRGSYTFPSWAN